MTELVRVIVENGIGELVLNRPQQRNSLIGPLVWEMQSGLEKLEKDEGCNSIVIRGEQGYFCAGLDLKAFSQDPPPDWRSRFQDDWAKFHKTIFISNKPIVGALQGFAIAGGSALALACDFLVVGEGSFMHVSEVERNMMAPINIFWLQLRHSYHRALKMALLGERHYGESLLNLGIADRCVPESEVLGAAREIAGRFAGFNGGNVRHLKYSIRSACVHQDFDELLASIKQSMQV